MVALNKRREFIKAGSRLRLTLIGKDEFLKHYIASLWALVFLGGVGARSRRGGGNLTVIDYNPKDLGISLIPTGYFDEWLVENLKRAKDLVGSSKTPCNEYSNLRNVKLVLSPREFNTWIEALNDIGNRFMNFRVKNKQRVFDTAVFGIPVRHSNGQFVKAEEDITRRSSPVVIKVVKTPKGKYMWMALWLWGRFLPNGVKLSFMGKTQEPSFKLIEEFFQELEGGAKK
jgi:CRISPR-associated protein Cmr1